MPEPRPHLSVEIRHRIGTLNLDVAFELTHPWTVLFGPSGSGKSTLLRVIAGLTQPQHGKILIRNQGHSQIIADTETETFCPSYRRPVRFAAQRPALFPNMSVRQNLRFVSESRPSDMDHVIKTALERFHLTPLADAMPATLSGGEQQRVSVARAAIAANGRLLLLDEPFTGLDKTLRDSLLADLQAWLADSKTPVLSVTHDIAEAFQLEAEVIKLGEGRVVEQGPAANVLAEERARLLSQLS